MTPTDTLEAECRNALQKQLLRRLKKLSFVIANLDKLKKRVRNIGSPVTLLSLSRLTDREERISDAEFDSLTFQFSAGRLQSKLSTKRLVKRLVWQTGQ